MNDFLQYAARGIRSFHSLICAETTRLGRPLCRADLTLDKVFPWAANLKIVERETNPLLHRVRLFGTGFVEIYGRDLTGQTLEGNVPDAAKHALQASFASCLPGTTSFGQIAFAWPDKKTVAYESLIYALAEPSGRTKFVVVGFRKSGLVVAP
jgi:hypothetical protein